MYEKKEITKEMTREKALKILEFRSHSKKELSTKLKRYGSDENDIDEVMTFLEEYHLIDDEAYARKYTKDLIKLKRMGKYRIKGELYNKGIDSCIIEEILSEIEDDTDSLLLMVEKKLGGNFEKKNTDKAIRYFAYRGYNISDIIDCIERIKSDEL